MNIWPPRWKATLQRTTLAYPAYAKLVTVTALLLCSVSLAFAVECIWHSFNEFRNAVNAAAFKHARKVFEQQNPGKQWDPSLLDSDNDGTADPLQASYYSLHGKSPYACSEFSAYVHNVLQKEFPQLQKGDIQTVWNHNHSIIRLRDGLICDGAYVVDGYRYVEPQGMRDKGAGTDFTRTLRTQFDDPNPIRSGINNPKWFYDGPQGSAGRWAGSGGGGGVFGGGNGVTQGLMAALLNSLMNNNGQPPPTLDDTLQRLKDSFEPSPTPVYPTPTPLPTKRPENTPTPRPTATSLTEPSRDSTALPEFSPSAPTPPPADTIEVSDDSIASDQLAAVETPSTTSSSSGGTKTQLRTSSDSSKVIDKF